ncbi:MAG: ABC transporter permease [Spirochaetales bacterium]|nr:ABC transporter permease [Spirochaetales bacterium]
MDRQKMVLVGIIFIIAVTLSIASPKFLMVSNFTNVLLQVAIIIIIASAANLLMITGNLDLSIGSILAFSGIMHAYLSKHGLPIWLSIIVTLILAGLWGSINGFTVGKLKIVSIIATMGTMYAARGFAKLVARWDGGANISSGLPSNFIDFGRAMVFGKIPLVLVFMFLAIAVFIFIEKKTVLGRYTFAIGDNASASELSGIKVARVITILYTLTGILAGFCGIVQVSRVGLAAPNIADTTHLDVIVAIVLGGTSMTGGEGSTFGMILGALIVGLASNGLNLLGVPFFYQQIVQGLLLVTAVFIDQKMRLGKRG